MDPKSFSSRTLANLLREAEIPQEVLEDSNENELVIAYLQAPSIIRDGKNKWIMLVPHTDEWMEALRPEVWEEVKHYKEQG